MPWQVDLRGARRVGNPTCVSPEEPDRSLFLKYTAVSTQPSARRKLPAQLVVSAPAPLLRTRGTWAEHPFPQSPGRTQLMYPWFPGPFTWTKDADTILAKATRPKTTNTQDTSVTRTRAPTAIGCCFARNR